MPEQKEPVLDAQDRKKRELIISGSIWKSVFVVCLPMAVFQLINQFFKVFDMSITSHINVDAVSAVSFFSQLSNVFAAIGTGIAIGAGIIIAGYYGKGEFKKVKTIVNSVFALSIIISIVLAVVMIAFAPVVMKIANTPDELKQIGFRYYIWQMIGLIFIFTNSVYISVEKARGNGKIILWLNLILAVVKFSLSLLFVFVFHFGITMISVATLLANMVITCIGAYRLRDSNDVFGISMKYISLRWNTLKKVFFISIPVIAEKVAFSVGKVMVNSVGVDYGTRTVGALGVSNSISGLSTTPPSSVGDGGSAIIRQNLGANKKERALQTFKAIFIINVVFGFIGLCLTLIFLDPLIGAFSNGNVEFATIVKQVFILEMISNVFVAVHASVMGLLYGFGYTKVSFLLNFARLFIFRLPLLIVIQKTTNITGGTAMGIVMMVSNGLTGISSIIAAIVVIYKQFGKKGFSMLKQPASKLNS